MNKRGIFGAGMILLVVFFVLILVLFSTINVFKQTLDEIRDGTVGGLNTGLNCPGTPNHDVTDYQNDTSFEKLVRRPTCFVTGVSMIWFIFAFLLASSVWVVKNWQK